MTLKDTCPLNQRNRLYLHLGLQKFRPDLLRLNQSHPNLRQNYTLTLHLLLQRELHQVRLELLRISQSLLNLQRHLPPQCRRQQ
jgi:hypothetical protein